MDNKTLTFTFFTLLLSYTVSAARPTACPPVTNPATATSHAAKTSGESIASNGGSKILLPGGKVISDETTGNINLHPEPEKIRNNDMTQRTNFSRFHPINRHFQGRPHRGPQQSSTRRPCMKHTQHVVPRTEVPHGKDEVAMERTDNPRSRTFRGDVPTNWLKVKHHYDSRHQHNNNNCNNKKNNNNSTSTSNNKNGKEHRDKNEENVIKRKNVLDREKMKSLKHQQKLKKSDAKSGLMKNIRKFLKYTLN